ncbi:MAG: hypothetical protein HWD85_01625 [Flavobacteriaceae bacterium]|nr:hypothetical protein [Flavobacteriaceae bacterium]
MKKTLTLIITTFIFTSCSGWTGITPTFKGFEFGFWNYTNEVYDAELVIGGFNNGKFIPTDSIMIDQIKIGGAVLHGYHFSGENRWQPNLDKIRNIPSERCYFKLKLTPQRQEMIIRSGQTDILGLKLPSRGHFKDLHGLLLISIRDTKIEGKDSQEL